MSRRCAENLYGSIVEERVVEIENELKMGVVETNGNPVLSVIIAKDLQQPQKSREIDLRIS